MEAARLRLSNGPIFTSGGIEGAQRSLVRRLALLHLLFLRVVVILLGGLAFFFLPTCKWRRLNKVECN